MNTMTMKPTENDRERAIAATAGTLLTGLLLEQISDIEDAAARTAEDSDSDKPVTAKASISIEWPAGAQAPKIDCVVSYALRRKTTGSLLADPDQMKLEIGGDK
jgi:hypothetical protein